MNKLVLFAFALFFVSFGSASLCYQETANTSHSSDGWCQNNLSYSGTYKFTNSSGGFGSSSSAYLWINNDGFDGDYFTASDGWENNSGANFTVNYSVPFQSINRSLIWRTKVRTISGTGGFVNINISIYSNCSNTGTVSLRLGVQTGSFQPGLAYCYTTGGTYELLYTYEGEQLQPFRLWEEGIYWNYSDEYILGSNQYNASTYETSYESFSLNITFDTNYYSAVSPTLIYNGTSYSVVVNSSNSNGGLFLTSLDIPTVTQTQNVSFYWNLTFTNNSGVINVSTPQFNQTVNDLNLTICDPTSAFKNVTAVNFTVYNATSPFSRINATFLTTWYYWIGRGSQKVNYTYQDTSITTGQFKFCIYPNSTYYHVDLDAQFGSTGFAQNYHYYRNATVNATVTEQPLYLLTTGLATLTGLSVIDDLSRGLADRLIFIQLYDVGTNSYRTVSMAHTNYEGKDISYLNWYDSFYKFIIVNNGTVEYSTDPYKVASTPQTFRINPTDVFDSDDFSNVQYTLYYNNVTGNFVLTYVDPTGRMASGCLRVTRASGHNISTVYDQCSSSSSATLSYNILGLNGTYTATFYGRGSFYSFDSVTAIIGVIESIYDQIGNLDGSTLALILTGTAAFLGLFSPVAAIVMLFLGFLASIALGLQGVTTPGFWGTFVAIFMIGGYLIWKLRV